MISATSHIDDLQHDLTHSLLQLTELVKQRLLALLESVVFRCELVQPFFVRRHDPDLPGVPETGRTEPQGCSPRKAGSADAGGQFRNPLIGWRTPPAIVLCPSSSRCGDCGCPPPVRVYRVLTTRCSPSPSL